MNSVYEFVNTIYTAREKIYKRENNREVHNADAYLLITQTEYLFFIFFLLRFFRLPKC